MTKLKEQPDATAVVVKEKKPRKKMMCTIAEGMVTSTLVEDISAILAGDRQLAHNEARLLVDLYYTVQHSRVSANNQVASLTKVNEPVNLISWFLESFEYLENQIKKVLTIYVEGNVNGRWLKAHRGIGPVISAGLLAHIDITKAQTAGAIWRFAGLDPTVKWGKGQKRPWNASLKRLCWILGDCIVKCPPSLYNDLYKERKVIEIRRNEAGEHKALAEVEKLRVNKNTDAYKAYAQGLLPDGRIHLRAQRWAVKIFLAHYHEQLWREHYKTMPPNPYVLEHGGHVHKIETEIPFTTEI